MGFLQKKNIFMLKIEDRKLLSAFVFMAVLLVYTVSMMMTNANVYQDIDVLRHLLVRIGWGCVIVAALNIIFLQDYSIGEMIAIVLLSVLLYISYKNSGNRYLCQSFIIAVSARDTNWRQALHLSLWTHVAMLAIYKLMEMLGIGTVHIFNRADGTPRYMMGTASPNVLGGYCLVIVLIWIALRFKKWRWFDYLGCAAIGVFVWVYPNSKTSVLLIGLALVLTLFFKLFGKKIIDLDIIRLLLIGLYPFCAFFTFIISYKYDPENRISQLLDRFLNLRVSYGKFFLDQYPHTWWGQRIQMVSNIQAEQTGQQMIWLDSIYLRLYISMGIIATIIAIVLWCMTVWYALKMRDFGILTGVIVMAIYGISAASVTYIHWNVFLIVLGYIRGTSRTRSYKVYERTKNKWES